MAVNNGRKIVANILRLFYDFFLQIILEAYKNILRICYTVFARLFNVRICFRESYFTNMRANSLWTPVKTHFNELPSFFFLHELSIEWILRYRTTKRGKNLVVIYATSMLNALYAQAALFLLGSGWHWHTFVDSSVLLSVSFSVQLFETRSLHRRETIAGETITDRLYRCGARCNW